MSLFETQQWDLAAWIGIHSRYAARSEPLPDKARLVGVAGTATHLRVL